MRNKIVRNIFIGLIITIFAIIIIKSFINDEINSDFESGNKFKELFVDSVSSHLKLGCATCNKEDTFYSYIYENKYNIIVWKLGKYVNVDSENITLSFVNNIRDFYFVPYWKVDASKALTIMRKAIKDKETSLCINVNRNTKLYQNDSKGFYLQTERIGLSYPKEKPHIIFDFHKEPKEVNLALRLRNKHPIIIILYPLEKSKLGCNMLEKLMRRD